MAGQTSPASASNGRQDREDNQPDKHDSAAEEARKQRRNKRKYEKKKAKKNQEAAPPLASTPTMDGMEQAEEEVDEGPVSTPSNGDEQCFGFTKNDACMTGELILNVAASYNVPSSRPDLYDIRMVEGNKKGRGVFAIRDISVGERIMDEKPMVASHNFKIRATRDVARQVKNLDDDTLARFETLSVRGDELKHWAEARHVALQSKVKGSDSIFPRDAASEVDLSKDETATPRPKDKVSDLDRDEQDMAATLLGVLADPTMGSNSKPSTLHGGSLIRNIVHLARYDSNRIFIERSFQKGSVVCHDTSWLNHSCRPNSFAAWNQQTHRMTIHAIRRIEANEEITINYVPEGVYEYQKRQEWLAYYHYFQCECQACVGHTAAPSDDRRDRLVELKDTWYPEWVELWSKLNPRDPLTSATFSTKALKAMNEDIRIRRAEGLIFGDLELLLSDKARMLAHRGMIRGAIEVKIKAYELLLVLYGKDHPYVTKRMRETELLMRHEFDRRSILMLLDCLAHPYLSFEPNGAPAEHYQTYERQARLAEKEMELARDWLEGERLER